MTKLVETEPYLNKWAEQTVSYNTRDLIIYALGIGCDTPQFVYEKSRKPKFAAFPTYPIVLGFKGDSQDTVNFPSKAMIKGAKKPPLPGVKVGLDGERYMEIIKPIPPKGAELVLKERLIGVHKKGSGATMDTETLITDKNGEVYCRLVSGVFMVGATDFKESGVNSSVKVAIPSRQPDATLEYKTSENLAKLYRLSGDYNPLHIDPRFAKGSGFKQPILHGLCSFGISSQLILQKYTSDPSEFKAVRVRFSKPVMPGETLVVETWKEGNRIVFQTKVKETGLVCVTNAYVDICPAPAKM
eukprot:TRINITY_DN4858_c0_g1_i1.p1 TRINITY_DN4858_c0_g1~~TRINITY_DN4858_c0_g1_i1.p1  ORF type:complete len:300 (+),score=47.00 TRINITY_DN4858_c0_g1_i1:197-1096(+)